MKASAHLSDRQRIKVAHIATGEDQEEYVAKPDKNEAAAELGARPAPLVPRILSVPKGAASANVARRAHATAAAAVDLHLRVP